MVFVGGRVVRRGIRLYELAHLLVLRKMRNEIKGCIPLESCVVVTGLNVFVLCGFALPPSSTIYNY